MRSRARSRHLNQHQGFVERTARHGIAPFRGPVSVVTLSGLRRRAVCGTPDCGGIEARQRSRTHRSQPEGGSLSAAERLRTSPLSDQETPETDAHREPAVTEIDQTISTANGDRFPCRAPFVYIPDPPRVPNHEPVRQNAFSSSTFLALRRVASTEVEQIGASVRQIGARPDAAPAHDRTPFTPAEHRTHCSTSATDATVCGHRIERSAPDARRRSSTSPVRPTSRSRSARQRIPVPRHVAEDEERARTIDAPRGVDEGLVHDLPIAHGTHRAAGRTPDRAHDPETTSPMRPRITRSEEGFRREDFCGRNHASLHGDASRLVTLCQATAGRPSLLCAASA